MGLVVSLLVAMFPILASAACYTGVNWVMYPASYNGIIDEKAIDFSASGMNATGNHDGSFRNMSEKKLNTVLPALLSAKAAKQKINLYCGNDA